MIGDDCTAALFEVSFSEVAELRGEIADATSAMAAALDVEHASAASGLSTVLRAVLCWLAGRNGETSGRSISAREVVAARPSTVQSGHPGSSALCVGRRGNVGPISAEAAASTSARHW